MSNSSIVFAIQLDGKGGAEEKDTVDDQCNWVHIDYSEPDAIEALAALGVNEWTVETLTRADTRPRALFTPEGTLLVLRAINMNPGSEPEDMVSLRLWLEPTRLITVRQRKLFSVQQVKDDLLAGEGPSNPVDIVIQLIARIADRISSFVGDIEERLEFLEEDYLENHQVSIRSRVASIRREVASVRRYLAPQREALESLYLQVRTTLAPEQIHLLREQIDRMLRYLEDLELIRDRALLLQEEMANLSMEQQNQRMYALSIVAAIFLPITFVSGVFGMNVAGLPGVEDANAFAYVAIFMLALSVSVVVFFKHNRWL